MKRIKLLLILCISAIFCFAQTKDRLNLEEVVSGTYQAEGLRGIVPMADGEHYTQMNNEGTKITKYSFATGKAITTLFDVATARDCKFKTFEGYQLSPDESRILIQTETTPIYRRSYTAVHYLFSIKNNKVEPLSDNGAQQVPLFSPDGNSVAFVRDNNLYLIKLLYGNSESQVTKDGKLNEVLNGIPDWVNEEEFGYNRAFEFSPDSKMLAFVRFDETQVPMFSFMLYEGQYPTFKEYTRYPGIYSYKYPEAGEKNAKVTVHSFDIKSKVIRQMNLPIDADAYIPRIRFTRDENALAVMTLNRTQNRFDLYFANPRSAVCKLIVRDESPYYINESNFNNIVFYPNNFSFISEKSGYNQLYWYSIGGNLIKQVTKGKYVVNKFLGWDELTNTFYYESNEESPLLRAVYKIDGKGKQTKLSQKKGMNTAVFSANMKYYLNTFSNTTTPPIATLNDNNGKLLKTLVSNEVLKNKLAQVALPQKEFFSFTTTQGVKLNAWMMKPIGFDTAKKYPVLMYQYSGPGSQEVLDKWTLSWENYMASIGYLVVCVDGQGTGGRGAEFEKCTYLKLGVKEANDQIEAAKYIGKQPYADKDRIAIWGWSYGGYTTLMSMSEGSGIFKAGIAVAAVTDWKYYDSIYAERFMRTPKENPEGYKAASAFTRINKLSGKLLLVHGTADDNVHYQNCAEYSEQLVQANKQFNMQIYTNRNHSIYGGNTRLHLYTRLTQFIENSLATSNEK
ncbi:MAG: S9 family peptidase [Bacteroides sp.]